MLLLKLFILEIKINGQFNVKIANMEIFDQIPEKNDEIFFFFFF